MARPIAPMNHLHLVGLGGSNKVMAGELSRLGRRALSAERARELFAKEPEKAGPGGLLYPFDADLARVAVMYHRTSARVLWGLYRSYADRLEPLYDDLRRQIEGDTRGWWREQLRFSVLAFGTDTVEAGERQVVGVVKNALIDGAEARGVRLILDPEKPDIIVHARSVETNKDGRFLSVSLDLAGRPMHQRGYRMISGEAPLREDLAAQLVMLSRFDARSDVFIDPMAGSGTLAVEAALMAAGKPVWMSGRSPDAPTLRPLRAAFEVPNKPLFADSAPKIYCAEVDEETYGALDRSLMTAGTSPQTTTFLGDFRDWDLRALIDEQCGSHQRGLILSNPPYGGRLGLPPRELRELYRDLGDWCSHFRGFRAGFIVGEPESDREARGPSTIQMFLDNFGGEPRVKKPMRNGPLYAQFLLYEL